MRNKNLRNRKGEIVVPSHGGKFPKDPESRLEALLAGLNTEPKQVLVLTCLDDTEWQTATDLWYNWKELEADWLPISNHFAEYCKYRLIPNGLAQTQSILYPNTTRPVKRYKLSEEGYYYGRPASVLMLKYSIETQKPLQSIIGKNNSSWKNTRPPANRVKLLRLLDSGITSIKELAHRLDVDVVSIVNNRLALNSSGLIEYQPERGRGRPNIQITSVGKHFLEELVKPLYSLCSKKPYEFLEKDYSPLDNPQIIRQYAIEGIRLYRNNKCEY
ncbi:MAG: hypothetical protein CMB97_00400 [Flavobacteriaceae bacterium]|nr:hypothetical protein [Flavobacteriaceae bacterium]